MRSSGATNFAPSVSVVALTKSTMDCLAPPSFHEGSGSCARTPVTTNPSANAANLTSETLRFGFIGLAFRSFIRLRFVVAGSVAGRFRRVLQTLQRVVNRKAAGVLARRARLERGQELPDVLLRGHEHERVVNPPVSIVYAFMVGGLERIGAQIEKFGEPQRHKWVLPHVQAVRALFGEDDFVLVVAERDKRTVVVEVKEFLAWARRFSSQRVGQVVAIEMNLEGLVSDFHSL